MNEAAHASPPACAEAIALRAMTPAELRRVAAAEAVDFDGYTVLDGALPPRITIERALAAFDAGTPPPWATPFLIVAPERRAVLGGCAFKSAPRAGEVEINYGIARSERGRGVASAALAQLLALAAASGEVRTVLAHVLPRNRASARLVARLGFEAGEAFLDSDGEEAVRWRWRVPR